MKYQKLATAALATLVATGSTDALAATPPVSAGVPTTDSSSVHSRTVEVKGIRIFYREAGSPDKPTILLLHGFPSSSHMYRDLIPRLSNDFHLVAPDYPGAGYSDAPDSTQFTPTFENLTTVMSGFVEALGLQHFAIYMQDFGGPVGFRMAVKHPEWVDGLIIQNANAYIEGIAPEQLQGMRARGAGPLTAEQRTEVEHIVSRDTAIFFYKTGARDFAGMSPDGYSVDSWILENPAARRIQEDLIINYYTNLNEYPRWQEYLRIRQPKTLIVWGKNDPLFLPPGAEAYKRDLPGAQLHFLNTGHFALEEDAPEIARHIRDTFGKSAR